LLQNENKVVDLQNFIHFVIEKIAWSQAVVQCIKIIKTGTVCRKTNEK